jgi:cytidylate kinase
VLLDGRDVTWAIRAPAVDAVVSRVAAVPEVRAALVEPQRRAAGNGPAVVVGRDIGTVIFPDAALKVYLDASLAERARRRAADLRARGLPAGEAEVLRDLTKRDQLDSERACAPLALPADGVVISTDGLSIDEVVDRVLALWREREGGNGRK